MAVRVRARVVLILSSVVVAGLLAWRFMGDWEPSVRVRDTAGTLSRDSAPRAVEDAGAAAKPAPQLVTPASRAASGPTIRGRVVDRGGIPVNHAEVRVVLRMSPDDWAGEVFEPRQKVRADATFEVPVPKWGRFAVIAEAKGFAIATRQPVRPGEEVELVVDAPARIAGRVVRMDDGRPLANAKVLARTIEDELRQVVTGADGAYALEDLPASSVWIETELEGFIQRRDAVSFAPGSSVERELRLDPGVMMAGRVVAREGGRPVAGAHVKLDCGARRVVTDADGRFSMSGLEPKSYVLAAWARGLAQSELRVRLDGRHASSEVVVALAPGVILSGIVVDEHGVPVQGARVGSGNNDRTDTDAEGRFEVTTGPETTYDSVFASKKGHTFASVPLAEAKTMSPLVIRLLPADARIVGTVKDREGHPIAGARVIAGDSQFVVPELAVGAHTADDGTFAIEGVQRQSWPMNANAPGFLWDSTEAECTAGGIVSVSFVLEPAPIWKAKIRGVAVDDGGAPIRNARVELRSPINPCLTVTETDGGGEFTLDAVFESNPFEVVVVASANGCEPAWERVDGDAIPPRLRVVLVRTGRVQGRVVDAATGSPIVDADIHVRNPDASWDFPRPPWWHAKSASDGTFCLDVPPGAKVLCASATGYLDSARLPLQAAASATAELGMIALARSGFLEGVITGSVSWPVKRWVFGVPPGGGALRWLAETDDTGYFSAAYVVPGRWEIFAAQEGHPYTSTHKVGTFVSAGMVEIAAGAATHLDVSIPAPATLTIAVASGPDAPASQGRLRPTVTTAISQPGDPLRDGEIAYDLVITSLEGTPLAWTDEEPIVASALRWRWVMKSLKTEVPITFLPAGAYRLELRGSGSESVVKTVAVEAGDVRTVSLELSGPSGK